MSPKMQTALAIYSGILSSFVAIAVWNNAAKQGGPSQFDAITAQESTSSSQTERFEW